MTEMRSRFHKELTDLEQTLLTVADQAEQMVALAVDAVCVPDMDKAARVMALDQWVDRTYLDVHNRWMAVMALQQPIAGDLRMMSVLLHLNTTLERMGDQCVNIAKLAQVTYGLPRSERIVAQIREMGDLVRPMIRTGVDALVRRNLEQARQLPFMDEPVDRLNRNMYKEVVDCGPDPQVLEWATRMMMVSRALERIGDQVVDIAEQTAFLLTGEMMEFTEEALTGSIDDGE
ncbi:MAG TPA: phosphate signaling complex protein PhoU [Acidimicrobiia bacterium]|jgi:phosphate transport system protein